MGYSGQPISQKLIIPNKNQLCLLDFKFPLYLRSISINNISVASGPEDTIKITIPKGDGEVFIIENEFSTRESD